LRQTSAGLRTGPFKETVQKLTVSIQADEIRSRTQNPAEYFSIWEEITKHISGTKWGTHRYMDMERLKQDEVREAAMAG
jgi:hypothetical protein